jgi:hypothetical protein
MVTESDLCEVLFEGMQITLYWTCSRVVIRCPFISSVQTTVTQLQRYISRVVQKIVVALRSNV